MCLPSKKITLLSAAMLFSGLAWADAAVFKPSAPCSTLDNYDPNYASYQGRYIPEGATENIRVSGFYQLTEKHGKLYAAFGGGSGAGLTPGMLVLLDADTLRFDKAVALPFQGHALSVDSSGKKAVVAHTYQNAFSQVDISSGKVACFKPDTQHGGVEYQGRYAVLADDGSFHISYRAPDDTSSVVMKYRADGQHDASFGVHVIENGLSFALYRRNGHLLTGAKGLKAVDADTGAVKYLTTETDQFNIYNYTAGPADLLLGASYGFVPNGRPNLALFDPRTNSTHAIYTGLGTVEAAYVPESGQAFTTNFDSKTVTVAALDEQAGGFGKTRFINIRFEGSPSNIATRRTTDATEVFIIPRGRVANARPGSALISKIRIAKSVNGIDGIDQPGACTITTFNILDKKVSAPEPCKILSPLETYRADVLVIQERLERFRKVFADTSKKLDAARAEIAKAGAKNSKNNTVDLQAELGRLEGVHVRQRKLVSDAESGVKVLQNMILSHGS